MLPDAEWDARVADQAMRQLAANILRCARGGGAPYLILSQMQTVMDAAFRCIPEIGPERTGTLLADALRAWDTDHEIRMDAMDSADGSYQRWLRDGTFDRMEANTSVVKGSLQVVASNLLGQRTQAAAGERERSSGLVRLFEIRQQAERERLPNAPAPSPKVRDQPHRSTTTSVAEEPLVYFITNDLAIKIGVSVEPLRRLRGLQTAHHSKLTLLGVSPGGYDLEAALHERFAADRLHGEWFRPSAELQEYIAEHAKPLAANDNQKAPETGALSA